MHKYSEKKYTEKDLVEAYNAGHEDGRYFPKGDKSFEVAYEGIVGDGMFADIVYPCRIVDSKQ